MAFDGFLEQGVTITISLGPMIDKDDGDTEKTGLTIEDTDVYLSKNGAAKANPSDTNDCTEDANGVYRKQLDGTDTGTTGRLAIYCHFTDCLYIRQNYIVLDPETYAGIVTGTAFGTDDKILVSTDAQDLSGSLDVNTKTITAAIIANATFNADVGSTAYGTNIIALAVRKVLDELNLDHLMKVATGGADMTTEIVDNSALSRILANGDTSIFDPSTDGLQLIRDVAPHGSAMVGTNNAALAATALSTAQWTAARAGYLEELAAANLPADVDTILSRLSAARAGYLDELAAANIPADVDTLLTRITAAVALASVCTEARLAELDAANLPTDIAAIPTTPMRGTDGANTTVPDAAGTAATPAEVATALANYDGPTKAEMDTAHALLATIAALATHDGKLDTVDAIVDAILVDTDATIPGLIAALNNLSAANVNAQVADVLRIDTRGEPGQGAPPVTASTETKIDYIFKYLRNKITTNKTTGEIIVFGDDGTTEDHKSTMSDDGTTFTRGEFGTGA